MADASTTLSAIHPPFTTKALLIDYIREHTINSPAAIDMLFRIAHTDLNGTGSMTGGDTVTPVTFGL